MIVLGIDYGQRRIGLALTSGDVAKPLPTLRVRDYHMALAKLTTLIADLHIEKIIFGLPSPDRIGAHAFGTKLQHVTGVDVVFRDETLTSQVALEKLKQQGKRRIQKEAIDAMSATLLLQETLDEA